MRSGSGRGGPRTISKLLRTATIAGLVTLVGASTAVANHGRPDKTVPIQGAVAGVDAIDTDAPGCPTGAAWRFSAESSGTMSHLGRVDMDVTHCTFSNETMTAGTFGPGTNIVKAANGDEIVLEQSGTWEIVFTDEGVRAYAYIDWTVLSGTGRFDGAEGAGTGISISDLAGANTVTFDGIISYDASQRRT